MKKTLIGVALAISCLVLPVATSPASAAGITVRFSVSKSNLQPGSSVLVIGSSAAKRLAATAKSVTLPKTFQKKGKYSFSLHIVNPDGTYGGPVVFGTTVKKTSFTTNIVTGKSMSLGTIKVQSGGWSKGSVKLRPGQYGSLLVGAAKTGKPKGAGTLGFVKRSGVSAKGLRAFAGTSCASVDQTLGTDCDKDGVPNAVDADDNNDGTVDMADQKTSSFESQKYLPWSTLYLEMNTGFRRTLNANIAGLTVDDIEAAIGGNNGTFAVNFYINLPPGEAESYENAWVDCGVISYCSTETGTATTSAPNGNIGSEFNRLWCTGDLNSAGGCESPIPWKTYTGTKFDGSGKGTKIDAPGVANALTYFNNNGSGVWAGAMIPNTGSGTLGKFLAGDPYVLKLKPSNGGAVVERPMSLGAYFVTVPAIKSANGTPVDYGASSLLGSRANPITVDDNGTLNLSVWRPQRIAVSGVDQVTGDQKFIDLGGLRYGLILNGSGGSESALKSTGEQGELGCSSALAAGNYTDVGSLSRTPDNEPQEQWNMNLWPLTDKSVDSPVSPDSVLTISFNLKKCVAELKSAPQRRRAQLDVSQTRVIPISLTAVGANLTGGVSRAAQTFYVQVPADVSGW